MKKEGSVMLIIVSIIVFGLFSSNKENAMKANAYHKNAPNATVLELKSHSVCLMEPTTGKILFEKNADERLRPASVTKIMTLLLIFESLELGDIRYEDLVTVSEHAASMGGSQCFFEQGEQQTVNDMIKCIEVSSGNDAAVAMAEHIAGSEQTFVSRMNEKAKQLGMDNTTFVNACGLEADGHLTTARDIAIMSRELITKYPEVFNYSTIWMDSIIHKTKKGNSKFDLANTNKFLKQYDGANGLKTGYTSQAKYCMSACASRNGVMLIAVIMGAETKELRNSEAAALLDFGFSKCKLYKDKELQTLKLETKITGGTKTTIECTIDEENNCFVTDCDVDKIVRNIKYNEQIKAPITKGDTIGKIQYICNNEVIYEIPIYALKTIDKTSFNYCFKSLFGELFMMTIN